MSDVIPEPRPGCSCMACQNRGRFLTFDAKRRRRELVLHELLLELEAAKESDDDWYRRVREGTDG